MMRVPVVNMRATGQNIARLREDHGFSVKDLQKIFGFSTPQAIYKWQQGSSMPTIDNILILASVFQVRVDDILITDQMDIDLPA